MASKIKALTWIADPHLEFLEENAIVDFAKRIENHPADAVLVTGDISDARRLALALVPPFAGAAWHEGCISTPDFLPL